MPSTIAELLAAAEPSSPRRLGHLIDRLRDGGQLRSVRNSGAGRAAAESAADALQLVAVRGVAYDSRRIGPGFVFVGVPGAHVDGHDYVGTAEQAGAAAAIVEHPVAGIRMPQLVVAGSQRALATAAAWWYADPSSELGVIGVTGTDGKTTTSFLAVAALEAAGIRTGLLGTVQARIGGISEPNPQHVTTPEAPELQATLRAMVEAADQAAVVETTSHGLALDRVAEIAYDAAIFTNLTHEHLEFHGSFENYRAAKLRLFERLPAPGTRPAKPGAAASWPSVAVVNRDDGSWNWFADAARNAGAQVVTYGTDPAADVRALRVEEDARRLRASVATGRWNGELNLRLAGRFNVHNALAVVALGEALGLDPEAVRAGLESVPGVPGRMERIDLGQPFGVVVDYAHSPNSLEKVLDILAPTAAARGGGLIAVFGSAGERDTAKRPMMGRIAGERCRLVVVTDEDPRGEDPMAILDEIAEGAQDAGRHRGSDLLLIEDRRAAIEAAFERARPGDIVLLAGKGHESSIIRADGPVPWDEKSAAIEGLVALGYGDEPGA